MARSAAREPGVVRLPPVVNDQRALRTAIVCDLLEERWPSMDLVADELQRTLPGVAAPRIAPTRLRPTMPGWPATIARLTRMRSVQNANRYLDRHHRYARWLRSHGEGFDAYHIVDHTYAHLVHELPAARTVVTCHDVDAFRCLFDPAGEPRSSLFRRMARRVLRGLQQAAIVSCDSVATRDALMGHGLRSQRLEVVPLGVHAAFTPGPATTRRTAPGVTILHVGSTVARKRIDVLLRVFARVLAADPAARLIRVGGLFTPEQTALARSLGIQGAITVAPPLSPESLADEYRSATLVLQPSEREGFGLPVAEAMACGAPVLASDIPVLREVGGEAARYAPVADIDAWADATCQLLHEHALEPERWAARRIAGIAQVAPFTWERCAARMAGLYAEVARG
jgi:glycosyltransferase involved in cell wall biosynthesis